MPTKKENGDCVKQTQPSHFYNPEGTVYSPDDIRSIAESVRAVKRYKRKQKGTYYAYYNVPCAFDIETTNFYEGDEKRAIMYIWMLGIAGNTVVGRTWDEFIQCIHVLQEVLQLGENRLMIYVHNLAFEFQFLCHRFEWDDVFALEERKVCYALTGGIEFRCSYILSGYSLDGLSKQLLKYPVAKMVGDLDYSRIRNSRTVMSEAEMGYCVNDVRVVMAYIEEQIEAEGRITYIPLTKTSYVRRFCRHACLPYRKAVEYRRMMKGLTLESDEYMLMKRCFQGGFTHANAIYVAETLTDVHSIDFTSSYPAVMVAFAGYPMSRGRKYEPTSRADFRHKLKHYCCMFDIEVLDVHLKEDVPDCYVSWSKCRAGDNPVLNNGRIYSADRIVTSMTDVDFEIFERCYEYGKFRIYNMYYYQRGYLPKPFIESILTLYEDKTTLKGVEGMEAEYQLKKGMLNSCYGMTVTDICRNEIFFGDVWESRRPDLDEAIEHYNESHNRFLFYAWGVYVTAYARRNLWTGILNVGIDDYVYSDTDSIKFRNLEKHQDYIEGYNKWVIETLKTACKELSIDESRICPMGQYLGVWSYEGVCSRFRTLGSKRYMTEKNGKISITVSGVNKRYAAPYITETYEDPFAAFNEELFIPELYTGKMLHTYIDCETSGTVVDYQGHEAEYDELSSVHLENTSYDFSMNEQFLNFIRNRKEDFYRGENEIL